MPPFPTALSWNIICHLPSLAHLCLAEDLTFLLLQVRDLCPSEVRNAPKLPSGLLTGLLPLRLAVSWGQAVLGTVLP